MNNIKEKGWSRLAAISFPIMIACGAVVPTIAAVIEGRVVDADKEPLPGAAVQVIQFPDTIRKGYTMADDEGRFKFEGLAPGKYMILLSMTGMDDVGKRFELPDSASIENLGDIELSENSVMLQEAVVTAVRAAVVAKQDTLEFNADSFHTRTNSTVEDLLKKLPGVEVGSDGSITSGGKSVKKILVDGKEFFADDPKAATKNLPSDIVDKVQVVDRKSDAARLTGIDDGDDETVINLTVKKGMNNGWFGQIEGGYGTDKRFEGSFNVNYFRDGNQISLIGGGNNINEMGFSDMGRGRFRDFGGNNGINTSWQTGLNFNVGKGEEIRVGGNIFYTYTDRDARSRSERQYLFPDSVSVQNGSSRTRDKGHNLRAALRLQWNINEYNTLEFRPTFSFSDRHSTLGDTTILHSGAADGTLVNSNLSSQVNSGRSYEAGGELMYNHRFGLKGRSFSIIGRYNFSSSRQHTTTLSDIEYYLRKQDSEELFRYLDTKEWSNSVEGRLSYTEALGNPDRGNFLSFSYRFTTRWNNGDRLTYNLPYSEALFNMALPEYDEAPDGAQFAADLSNSFRNRFTTQELQVGYKKNASNYTLDAGMLASPSYSSSEDLINPARNVKGRTVWNVSPYARFRYNFSKTTSLSARYRARTSAPSISNLQPVADVTDPLNIKIGNPDLKPSFTQTLMAHFNSFHTESQRSIMAVANISMTMNSVVSRTVTNPTTGARTTTYANANGAWNAFGMGMFNTPLRRGRWRLNARLGVNYSGYPGYINGEFNRSGNLGLSPSAGFTYSLDIFQASVNPTYRFGLATNSLPEQPNRYTHAYGFDASVLLSLPFGLQLSSDLDFSKSTGMSAGYNTSQWLWNAQLSYSMLRDKSLTLSVRAYDLLGDKKNVIRSVSANMITDSQYNDLTRYVMFSISWKFNSMSRKSTAQTPIDMMPSPPGGHGERGERPQGPTPGGMHGGPGRMP